MAAADKTRGLMLKDIVRDVRRADYRDREEMQRQLSLLQVKTETDNLLRDARWAAEVTHQRSGRSLPKYQGDLAGVQGPRPLVSTLATTARAIALK